MNGKLVVSGLLRCTMIWICCAISRLIMIHLPSIRTPFEPQPDGVSTIFPFTVKNGGPEKSYIELPYTLPQDFLLFVLMRETTIDIWKRKLDWIAEKGGMALLIAHPDYMNMEEVIAGLMNTQ